MVMRLLYNIIPKGHNISYYNINPLLKVPPKVPTGNYWNSTINSWKYIKLQKHNVGNLLSRHQLEDPDDEMLLTKISEFN